MEVLMIKFQVELERGEAASDKSLECSWVDTSIRDRVEEYPSLSSWDGDQVKTFVLLFCCLFVAQAMICDKSGSVVGDNLDQVVLHIILL